MQYVRLGATGLKVSRLCLGCMTYGSPAMQSWILQEEDAKPFFKQALDAGINFFDTADVYSTGESERIVGRSLLTYAKRHQVVIATKVSGPMGRDPNNRGLSRRHLFDAIDRSLQRLGTDYVDLYQIHRFDYETPIEETLEALNDIVRAGKVRYIGALPCTHGSSQPCSPPVNAMAGANSSPCNRSTTWSTAKKNVRCCHYASVEG